MFFDSDVKNNFQLSLQQNYIGKTGGCLYSRTKEHWACDCSEVLQHITSSEQFNKLELQVSAHNVLSEVIFIDCKTIEKG